jgi:hypothetical protein
MLTALRDWFGNDTPRCWTKLADMFDDHYFTVLNHPDDDSHLGRFGGVVPTPLVRLNIGMLIAEAAAARPAATGCAAAE